MATSFLDNLPLPAFLKPAEVGPHYGVIGDFDTPEDLLRVARRRGELMFELSVLFGAFGALLGMFHLNRMPTYYHAFFNYSKAAGASNDRFLLAVEAADPKFRGEELRTLLDSLGSRHSELVEA